MIAENRIPPLPLGTLTCVRGSGTLSILNLPQEKSRHFSDVDTIIDTK